MLGVGRLGCGRGWLALGLVLARVLLPFFLFRGVVPDLLSWESVAHSSQACQPHAEGFCFLFCFAILVASQSEFSFL